MNSGPASGRIRRWRIGCCACLLIAGNLGCLVPSQSPEWGSGIPESDFSRALEGYPPEAAASLMPLSRVFYGRITSRRFNSRATFEDPSVRQFFPSVAAYSDYYAALADAIDRAYLANNRPRVVELRSIERDPNGSVKLEVRFIGENDRPLRWWSASLVRRDEWSWSEGRWWVVPGKV